MCVKHLEGVGYNMRECAYVRVSTDLLEQDSSYINQEQMYLNLGINHIYKDKESGTSINRQGFISMLEDCGLEVKAIKTSTKDKLVVLPTDRPSKYDKIYCKSISRFSRDTSSAIEIIRLLKANKTYCYFEQENIDTSDTSSDFLLGIMLSISESESKNTSMRVKKGNQITAQNGVFRGHNIMGYDYDKNTKQIAINDLEAKIVKEIFSLRLEGKGARVIANIINKQGFRTKLGKEFSANTVQNILQNKTYCGYSRRNTFISEGFGDMTKRVRQPKSEHILVKNENIPPIIDEETFEKVQELILSSKHQYKNIGKNTSKNPLVGKVICSKCGGNYVKVGNYYVCLGKHKKGKSYCNNSNVALSTLQDYIDKRVRLFGRVKDVNLNVLNGVLDKCISIATDKRDNNTSELLERNTEAIRRHKQAINKLLDLMLDGGAKEVIEDKINSINESIELLNKENNILLEGESYINGFINRCEETRSKISEYILNLPKFIDRDTYIKDYLISIKVQDNTLTYKDKSIKYANEVKALYEEIN